MTPRKFTLATIASIIGAAATGLAAALIGLPDILAALMMVLVPVTGLLYVSRRKRP